MTAPVFAEGRVTFEDKAGGAFVVVSFDKSGASILVSRGELFAAGRDMQRHALAQFEQQQADVMQFDRRAEATTQNRR